MVSPILFVILGCLVLYRAFKWATYYPPGFPPGPPRIPLVGSYLFLLLLNKNRLHLAALKLSEWYKSKLVGVWYANYLITVVNDYKGIKEILTRKEFDGKPDLFAARIRDPHRELRGIFFTEGTLWKEQRWFMLRFMRDYGFGRRHETLECHIREELMTFIEMLRNGAINNREQEFIKSRGLANIPLAMAPTLVNCFFQVIISERLPRNEFASLVDVAKLSITFQRKSDSYGRLFSVIPWITNIFPEKSDYNQILATNHGLYNFLKNFIDKQIDTYDESHERHFIDKYIKMMKISEKNQDFTTGFFYDQFIFSLMDFFLPAITAIAAQIALLFQLTIAQPEVEKKIQQEIDEVVGNGRLPTLDDRTNMPYTEACIREIMRYDTPLPSGIPHKVLVDTELQGYKLPAGSFVVPGHYAMHMDEEYWGDPEAFRPERFIGENGKIDLKADITMPFGAGKRLCAGETFARNLFFLFVSAVYQNFNLKLRDEDNIQDIQSKNTVGLITSTPDFWIKFETR